MKHQILYYLLFASLILASCTGMDEEYKEFKVPETKYVGAADSIKFLAGENRMVLQFRLSDPFVSKVNVYWNNRTDSVVIPVEVLNSEDIFEYEFDNMPEGSYAFDIITYDDLGNKSIDKSVIGSSYANKFRESLLDTPVKRANRNDTIANQADIRWGSYDPKSLGIELSYTTTGDETAHLYLPNDVLFLNKMITLLSNHKDKSDFQYRTLYVPEPSAVDTFYTPYRSVHVKGIAIEYPRTGWIAEGTDYDGTRVPQNLLDGNTATIWHMYKGTGSQYPHIAIIDMLTPIEVSGVYFIHRLPITTPLKLVGIKISNDKVSWTNLGDFTMPNNSTVKEYFDFPMLKTCRYIQIVAKSDYNNGANTGVAEFGVYKREGDQ